MSTKGTWKTKALWPEIKSTLDSGHDIIVFDLETTGLSSKNDRIIEIAAIKFSLEDGYQMVEKDVYHQYINPGRPLEQTIIDLTGITDEQLADMPTEDKVLADIVKFFDGCILSGYNIDTFDMKFMNELYGRYGMFFNYPGTIDGIKMARNRLERGKDVEGFKLSVVGDYFGLEFNAHSAIEDARTTGKLVQIFLREYASEEAEPEEARPSGTLRPTIQQISFWPGFKGFSRIYVNCVEGSVFYDIRSSTWGGKDIDVSTIDMDWLETEVYRLTNSSNESEFAKFRDSIAC